jgi:hypothetical protein
MCSRPVTTTPITCGPEGPHPDQARFRTGLRCRRRRHPDARHPSSAFGRGRRGLAVRSGEDVPQRHLHRHREHGRPAGHRRPGGPDPKGLPLGLQLIGRPFEEETLFKTAHVIEQAAGRFEPKKWWLIARLRLSLRKVPRSRPANSQPSRVMSLMSAIFLLSSRISSILPPWASRCRMRCSAREISILSGPVRALVSKQKHAPTSSGRRRSGVFAGPCQAFLARAGPLPGLGQ